ncbi:MAG TPA: glycosyltransferase family 9 protein, partial [Bacteroidota bacterium]
MRQVRRILVIQTAFIGDVILTLPLMQVLKDFFADALIDVVVVPRSSEVCRNHPSIHRVVQYDKRGADKGLGGLFRLGRRLHEEKYDLAMVPHRSLRSALLSVLAGSPLRIGFKRSMGRFLMTSTVRYDQNLHEVERNLALLEALGIRDLGKQLPRVFPGPAEALAVDEAAKEQTASFRGKLVAIAP